MARRFFAIVGLLFLLAGVVWLPLGAGEKTAKPDMVLKGHTDAVYAVAFSPDGKYLITASFDHTLKLWDTATGKEIKTYGGATGHTKQVISVAFNQDGSMIASGSTDNTLKVWDVPVNAPIRSLRSSDAVQAVALSSDGLKLAICRALVRRLQGNIHAENREGEEGLSVVVELPLASPKDEE